MKNKLVLIALFAIFFAPVLVAVVLNSKWVNWRAAPEKAHGELIEPVIPFGAFEYADASGQPRELSDLLNRWHLLLVSRQPCREDCLETAALMRNIRLAQDRHRDEVGLIMLHSPELTAKTRRRIAALDPTWLLFDKAPAQALTARLPEASDGTLYIVDPKANIIERFGPDTNLTGVRKDLDRLLTWTLREQQ